MVSINDISNAIENGSIQSLKGQSYSGVLAFVNDDAPYALHIGDYLIVIDFDRMILEVIYNP